MDSPLASFEPIEAFARRLDEDFPVRGARDLFHLPTRADGRTSIYFCTQSLGLQPRATRPFLEEELANWEKRGIDGYFEGERSWYRYSDSLVDAGARLVGGKPGEAIFMNSLTINLHLMLTTFYRPRSGRTKILMEAGAFPSDAYAIETHLEARGRSADETVITVEPDPGTYNLRTDQIEDLLEKRGQQIALVFLPGVQYLDGQLLDMKRITAAAQCQGCKVGFDLAHAVGNVELELHDWNVDFAVWCSYKYLYGGPGAVGGCFVHERHGKNRTLPRLAGWWGNDPDTRFQMAPQFTPREGASGWQVSTPQLLSLAPLIPALNVIESVGLRELRVRSTVLTAYLELLLQHASFPDCKIITPTEPEARGCQLSFRIPGRAREVLKKVSLLGVVCDVREPDIVRVAPAPMYNTFTEVWTFVRILEECLGGD